MYFTTEEYAQMVEEVLGETPCFTTLLLITYKVFEGKKKAWGSREIYNDADLQGRIQTAFEAKVLKGTHGILLPGGPGSSQVCEPSGYHAWLCKVCDSQKNEVITRWFKSRNAQDSIYGTDGKPIDIPTRPAGTDISDDVITEELLRESFRRVMESKSGSYKILAWLAHRLYHHQKGLDRDKCSNAVAVGFGEYTLNKMWLTIRSVSRRVSWMQITPQQRLHFEELLAQPSDSGVPYGEMKFKDLFMKKGGAASVSDWVNRIDRGLWSAMPEAVEKLPEEKSKSKNKKKDGGSGENSGAPILE